MNRKLNFIFPDQNLLKRKFRLDDFYIHFKSNIDAWRSYYELTNPESGILPEPYDTAEDMIKLIILKCIRPDKVVPAVRVSLCVGIGVDGTFFC